MRFGSRFSRFLYGRYGADPLYNFLFIVQIILLILGVIFTALGVVSDVFTYLSFFVYLIAIGVFGWTMFRCMSRNIAKRQKENQAYLRLKYKLFGRKKKAKRPADTAEYIFRACPRCRSVLRLPRRVGKHTVKCPRCDNRFDIKVKK